MQDKVCVHALITGLVQGVWFRAGTKDEATRLGLSGWVRNVGLDQVETLAYGDKDKIEAFVAWLHKGPPRAKVSEVVCNSGEWTEKEGEFVIK